MKEINNEAVANALKLAMKELKETSVSQATCIRAFAMLAKEHAGMSDDQEQWIISVGINGHGLLSNASQCRQWFDSYTNPKSNKSKSKLAQLLNKQEPTTKEPTKEPTK